MKIEGGEAEWVRVVYTGTTRGKIFGSNKSKIVLFFAISDPYGCGVTCTCALRQRDEGLTGTTGGVVPGHLRASSMKDIIILGKRRAGRGIARPEGRGTTLWKIKRGKEV